MNYTKYDTVLEYALTVVRSIEQRCGPNTQHLECGRKRLFAVLHDRFGDIHPFVYQKGSRDYLTTVDMSPHNVTEQLYPTYHRNFASSVKYRMNGGEKQYTHSSWVYDHVDSHRQHHVYLFGTDGGSTDIYTHTETSVREGAEHLIETEQDHATVGQLTTIFSTDVIDDV